MIGLSARSRDHLHLSHLPPHVRFSPVTSSPALLTTPSHEPMHTHRQTDRQTPRESIPVNLYLPFAIRICFICSYTCVTIRMCTFVHIHVDIITSCSQYKKKDYLCKQPLVPKLFPSTNKQNHTASNRKLSRTWEQG